jgi:hypothetical protein
MHKASGTALCTTWLAARSAPSSMRRGAHRGHSWPERRRADALGRGAGGFSTRFRPRAEGTGKPHPALRGAGSAAGRLAGPAGQRAAHHYARAYARAAARQRGGASGLRPVGCARAWRDRSCAVPRRGSSPFCWWCAAAIRPGCAIGAAPSPASGWSRPWSGTASGPFPWPWKTCWPVPATLGRRGRAPGHERVTAASGRRNAVARQKQTETGC